MPDQQKLATLNNQFGIEGQLQFKAAGDLIVAEITSDHSQASIVLQGAQVLSWVPNGEQPVIWLSEDATFIADKTIRGGIPVCWPWFGAHPDNNEAPAHGFVRAAAWDVVETKSLGGGQSRIVFRLPPTEVPSALWPHSTELEFQVTVGASLELNLITRNKGAEAITISQALHSYFAVSDRNQVVIKGLEYC
jgi:glucose-6-phosphate 1-epimerase